MKNRAGGYKKILIDSGTLKVHGDYLRSNLAELKKRSLSPVDFATLYLLLFLRIKHPKNWLQKKNHLAPSSSNPKLLSLIPETFKLNDWEKEKLKGLCSLELFLNYNLKAIPESVNRAMINWHNGAWNIVYLEHIPNPRELLAQQVINTRCVTLITDPAMIDTLIFESRDPLSFMVHDLMHADQFFNVEGSLFGQLGFYKLINDIYDRPELKALMKSDKKFKGEFEYITSDMNAYVIHLFKCLKSALYRTHAETLFLLLLEWWKMNTEQQAAAEMVNSSSFNQEHEKVLKSFFEKHVLKADGQSGQKMLNH